MGDNGLVTLNMMPESEVPVRPSFADRIQRAHELSQQCASASGLLSFYAELALLQQHVFDSLNTNSGADQNLQPTAWPLLTERLAPLFPDFLRSLAGISPQLVYDRAAHLASSDEAERCNLLTRFWGGELSQSSVTDRATFPDRFVALAFLQPYAEWLAQSHHAIASVEHRATCPICSSEPLCAVLRDQYHGARRGLICSLCMYEWSFPRMKCPACGEERFEALPVFTPEAMPHVRIDACDTCKQYIKTVDLTKDGNAVPVVDELAAASLDIWARDQGYSKLTLNIAGV